jgi:outer membrane protein assembly factor BamB
MKNPCLLLAFFSLPLSVATAADSVGQRIIERSGLQNGVAAIIGIDRALTLELAKASKLIIHVRAEDAGAVYQMRRDMNDAGFGINRIIVESGSTGRLPYAENSIDLLVRTATATAIARPSKNEILRVLRPQGFAFTAPNSKSMGFLRKPPMAGAGDWSHWENKPDNNPVSSDKIIKAPYMTQFMSLPYYIGMPSVTTAAAGRTFLAIGHIAHHEREWEGLLRLIARNGYNGQVLWERKLPLGYLVHRSAFIATKDVFYMLNGDHCLLLDSRTGAELGQLDIPKVKGDWKWMAMHDGKLYALIGKPDPKTEIMKGDRSIGGWSWGDLSKGYYENRVPFGFGHTLVAFDLKRKEIAWQFDEDDGVNIDARGMAIHGNRIFFYSPDHHLKCLAADTGSFRWENDDKDVLGLIERPGKGLVSTPGFRTACLMVASEDALLIQGQTRMNVVGISAADGKLLWQKKKITNNPNAIFVDGKFVLGVGKRGTHVVVDPVSGKEEEDLKFFKRACTRLTATEDSFFCRGEGTLRFDRKTKKVLVDGSVRPACNDGALPANGMLYVGPWQCDCNLSIIGHVGKTSAGNFDFSLKQNVNRLQKGTAFRPSAARGNRRDWSTYRGNNERSASVPVNFAMPAAQRWQHRPDRPFIPSAPTSAGEMIYLAGDDGQVRGIDAKTGRLRWRYLTPAPIKYPPSISNGRAYVGCSDGHVYCLSADRGELLWRFRAAPVERHIMVYGNLVSTWPVNSGVMIHNGTAYFAAGIIDHDGTYVYALNAETGELKWQNETSGHLDADLRKGVSVQGNLTVQGNHLLLAGGNQVSPARFDLKTGKAAEATLRNGNPIANNGRFVGVFGDTVVAGGRILHSSPRNVSNKNSFDAYAKGKKFRFSLGGIAPAWNDNSLSFVNSKYGKLSFVNREIAQARIEAGYFKDGNRPLRGWTLTLAQSLVLKQELDWQTDVGEKFEVLSIALANNAVIAVVRRQEMFRSQRQWWVMTFDPKTGRQRFQQELTNEPLPEGLLIDRNGHIVVVSLNGNVQSFGKTEG